MHKIVFLLAISALVFSCKKSDDATATYTVNTTSETAQQVGDVTASVDESGGSSGGGIPTAMLEGEKRMFARLSGEKENVSIAQVLVPEAQAADCKTIDFGACAATGAGKKVRNFDSCTTPGGGTITGSATLTFAGSAPSITACKLLSNGDSVSRLPNITITGLRGATFVTTGVGAGQTTTRVDATNFTFANAGINRKFTTPKGVVLLDVTTTGSGIAVSGASRANRTMTGGTIVTTNNLTAETCTLIPNAVTWGSATCNCPTSGSFNGSCGASTFTVAFLGTCGQSTVTKTGEASQTVTMDRCATQ